jgi:hypothetical protein
LCDFIRTFYHLSVFFSTGFMKFLFNGRAGCALFRKAALRFSAANAGENPACEAAGNNGALPGTAVIPRVVGIFEKSCDFFRKAIDIKAALSFIVKLRGRNGGDAR